MHQHQDERRIVEWDELIMESGPGYVYQQVHSICYSIILPRSRSRLITTPRERASERRLFLNMEARPSREAT
jgi:hypothetical protein